MKNDDYRRPLNQLLSHRHRPAGERVNGSHCSRDVSIGWRRGRKEGRMRGRRRMKDEERKEGRKEERKEEGGG